MELKWTRAPVKTEWGDMMMQAHLALSKDSTLSLYCEKEMCNMVSVSESCFRSLTLTPMVIVTKEEYEEMQDRIYFLTCLEANGVDNWDWYDEACNEYHLYKDGEV